MPTKHKRIVVNDALASKIYRAIDDPIMNLRLIYAKKLMPSHTDTDLYNLTVKIWKEIANILNVKP